jgi:hypothetical protein
MIAQFFLDLQSFLLLGKYNRCLSVQPHRILFLAENSGADVYLDIQCNWWEWFCSLFASSSHRLAFSSRDGQKVILAFNFNVAGTGGITGITLVVL